MKGYREMEKLHDGIVSYLKTVAHASTSDIQKNVGGNRLDIVSICKNLCMIDVVKYHQSSSRSHYVWCLTPKGQESYTRSETERAIGVSWEDRGDLLIVKERHRQQSSLGENFSQQNDLLYKQDELPRAAAAYLLTAIGFDRGGSIDAAANSQNFNSYFWPFPWTWLKLGDRKQNLIKAGALIAAELDRMNNAERDACG